MLAYESFFTRLGIVTAIALVALGIYLSPVILCIVAALIGRGFKELSLIFRDRGDWEDVDAYQAALERREPLAVGYQYTVLITQWIQARVDRVIDSRFFRLVYP